MRREDKEHPPDMARCSYVEAVVPLVAEPVPPDMPEHGPEVVDVDWLVPLGAVLDSDAGLVCADAKERDVSAARIAKVMTAATRIVFLSVLNLRLILYHPHTNAESRCRN